MTNDIFSLLNQHEINNNDLFQQALQNANNSTTGHSVDNNNFFPPITHPTPKCLDKFTIKDIAEAVNQFTNTLAVNAIEILPEIIKAAGSSTNGIIGSFCDCCKK